MRNETYIWLKWLRIFVQRFDSFLRKNQKYLCLIKRGEPERTLPAQITDKLILVVYGFLSSRDSGHIRLSNFLRASLDDRKPYTLRIPWVDTDEPSPVVVELRDTYAEPEKALRVMRVPFDVGSLGIALSDSIQTWEIPIPNRTV